MMRWALILDRPHKTAVTEILNTKSARIIAVVGGGILEDTVERTLEVRLKDDPNILHRMIGVDRPLGNVGPQIDMLYLLHAIDGPTRTTLSALTKVRNFFAHHLDAQSFDDQDDKLQSAMENLKLHNGRKFWPHHLFQEDIAEAIPAINSGQDKFLVNLQLGLIFLMRDRVSHNPHSNQPVKPKVLKARYGKHA